MYVRLPLSKSTTIRNGNALAIDWDELLPPKKATYIVGNPPFVGSKHLDDTQRKEMGELFGETKNYKILDYVSAWYLKATEYMAKNKKVRSAFVSTNSITQGEQVGPLWGEILKKGITINFAHRTFQWTSEARGKAAVHCIIVGFSYTNNENKTIYDYETPVSDPQVIPAANINPYLIDGPTVIVERRGKPLCKVPPLCFGNMPLDGGNLLMNAEEKDALLAVEPNAGPFIRKFLGANEFLNNIERYCIWLVDVQPHELRSMPHVLKRVEKVKEFRLESKRSATREKADNPAEFGENRHPSSEYLIVPRHTSMRREYIPFALCSPDIIAGDSCLIIPNMDPFHFGVLQSQMHMDWVRYVGGRLKSDYRYSKDFVYNNFPWPPKVSKAKKTEIEKAAKAVTKTREQYPGSSLADLYDPISMPSPLRKAHVRLDKVVQSIYTKKDLHSSRERMDILFKLYLELTKKKKKK